ncbi:carbamoyltransferase HypF, partial [Candidatus Pacearchaeota archaeon]|nr:carbamoyltransferase HypF [Candidatus Pacearchaeota archaeon]
DRKKWAVLEKMIEQKTNCPLTSSMGRLFDAVSSLVRLRDKINYEGQAAIELEQLVNQIEDPEFTVKNYEYQIVGVNDILIIRPWDIITGIVQDLRAKVSPSMISARFHNTISDIIVVVCKRIREETKLNEVALSGGVFQNMILLDKTFDELHNEGFKVYIHHRVPTNDGGICLGQAVIAGARLRTKVKD